MKFLLFFVLSSEPSLCGAAGLAQVRTEPLSRPVAAVPSSARLFDECFVPRKYDSESAVRNRASLLSVFRMDGPCADWVVCRGREICSGTGFVLVTCNWRSIECYEVSSFI